MAKRRSVRGRRGGVNKSQAIRDYLARDPAATPKVIIAGLAKQGISVSDGLVSVVKYAPDRRKLKRGGRRQSNGRARRQPRGSLSVENLVATKKLADRLGGLREVREALDTLEKLR
jgi:hypothetical protein